MPSPRRSSSGAGACDGGNCEGGEWDYKPRSVWCPNCGTERKDVTLIEIRDGGIVVSGGKHEGLVQSIDSSGMHTVYRNPTIKCEKCNRIFRKSDITFEFNYKDNW